MMFWKYLLKSAWGIWVSIQIFKRLPVTLVAKLNQKLRFALVEKKTKWRTGDPEGVACPVPVATAEKSRSLKWNTSFVFVINSELVMQVRRQHPCAIGHFRVPKTLTFKMRLGTQPFLWKWVLFAWEWKMISISKAEHLPFWLAKIPRLILHNQLALTKFGRCKHWFDCIFDWKRGCLDNIHRSTSFPGAAA